MIRRAAYGCYRVLKTRKTAQRRTLQIKIKGRELMLENGLADNGSGTPEECYMSCALAPELHRSYVYYIGGTPIVFYMSML